MRLGRILAWAGGYALVEILVAILVGRYAEWGRAEPLLFLAFRPWLLLALALLLAHRPRGERLVVYPAALLIAIGGEALFLKLLDAPVPLAAMVGAALPGLVLALLYDSVIGLGRARMKRRGRALAAVLLVGLLIVTGGLLALHGRWAVPADPAPPETRPPLALMTALPLVWGEGGGFDPDSRPARSYVALQSTFEITLLDALTPDALATARLLFIAQPRALAPEEMVALDDWVRGGGRLLLLADPSLQWHSHFPVGDVRRPPPFAPVAPLLARWGVDLRRGGEGLVLDHVRQGGHDRRLTLAMPGRFAVTGPDCATLARDWLARCDVGAGRVLLVADADLLDDRLWVAPVGQGDSRQARLADNPWIVAGWLDRLGDHERALPGGAVAWRRPGTPIVPAFLLTMVPLVLLVAGGAAFARTARPRTGGR